MGTYLLTVHAVAGEPAPAPEVMEKMFADVDIYNGELRAEGAWSFAGGLNPPSGAEVVSPDGSTSDGPFITGGTQAGGFWIVTAGDDDAARSLAARASAACRQPVELRKFQDEA